MHMHSVHAHVSAQITLILFRQTGRSTMSESVPCARTLRLGGGACGGAGHGSFLLTALACLAIHGHQVTIRPSRPSAVRCTLFSTIYAFSAVGLFPSGLLALLTLLVIALFSSPTASLRPVAALETCGIAASLTEPRVSLRLVAARAT